MVKDRVVLITGGAGTLGRALTRHILKLEPKYIKIFDNSEYFQVDTQRLFNDKRLHFHIGDVRDPNRLKRAMRNVDIAIHAAALKHVPICEDNPIEAIRTNVDGSINVIESAMECGVDKVVFISTDKAVEPMSIYGATKFLGERLFTNSNVPGGTKFSCVRLVNFEVSRGSVAELWARQFEGGEAITITDSDMTRLWLSLDYTCELVLKFIDLMKGGEIFIPKYITEMGIKDLANKLYPNAEKRIIGKRKGEKIKELLFSGFENPIDCGDYYKICE